MSNKIIDTIGKEEENYLEEFDKGYNKFGGDIEFDSRITELIDKIIPNKDLHVSRKINIICRRILNQKTLHYRIFCKQCQRDFEDGISVFELREEDVVYDNRVMLNCHWCNNYSIFVGEKITERFREGYFSKTPKEILNAKPKYRFEWRVPR